MTPDSGVPGNGKTLAVHEYQLRAILDEVRDINGKMDKLLPTVAVHDAELCSLRGWRAWSSGIGGSLLLALIGLVLAHMFK